MKLTKSYCPLCGAKEFHRTTKPLKLIYKGSSFSIEQPGFWCDVCGEGVVEGKDIKATREEIQTVKAKIDGLLTPHELFTIRKKDLRINQRQASEICGGGPNAFSRYERGELPPPRAVSNLMRILKRHPEELERISRSSKKRKGNNEPKKAAH